MTLIPTESILTGDGHIMQIYRVNGIEDQVMHMAQRVFQQIAANNAEEFPNTARMSVLSVLCNGNETRCDSARDLAELLSLLDIPTPEAIAAMNAYFSSACQQVIINSCTSQDISTAA